MPFPRTALLCLPLAVGLALAPSFPAGAEAFGSAEALRAATEAWLQERLLRDERIEALELEGETRVTEQPPGSWHIVLPPARLRLAAGGALLSEPAELSLAPREDGQLELAWRLPPAVRHQTAAQAGASAASQATLSIARQRGSGRYDPSLGGFRAFDALLGEIDLKLPAEAGLSLAELGLRGDSRPHSGEAPEGLVDSSGAGSLRGLAFRAGPIALSLESLRLDSELEGLRLEAYAAALAGLAGGAAAPRLLSFREPLFEAGALSLSLAGLDLASGPTRLALQRGEAALALEGLTGERSAVVLRLSLEALRAEPLPPLTGGLLPRDLGLELELLGLPNAPLDALLRQFETVAATAGAGYAAGLTLPDLWRLLQQAGAEVRLTALAWDSALLRLQGDAALNPSAEAPLGFFGQLRFEIEGLPELLALLRNDPQAQRLIPLLTLLQGLGQPLDPERPAGARRYAVLATLDGRLEVNGTDVMPLLPRSP